MTVRFLELYGAISLQSKPQPGRRRFGVPVGGPFDPESHALANALLGNADDCACLELSAVAGKIEVVRGGTLSWVGAGAIQGSREFKTGEILDLAYPREGCRSYVGMSGGVIPLSDARSFGSGSDKPIEVGRLAIPQSVGGVIELRAIRGKSCSASLWQALLAREFGVDPHSNRIGVRLSREIPEADSGERTSEPTDVGVIQLPPSGGPILLGPDGPTIGGYPVLGSVIRADLAKVGQLQVGARVRFKEVDLGGAALVFQKYEKELARRSLLLRLGAGSVN